jgi:hypothetical protein
MERTVTLLKEKNQYLEKFYTLNECEFLNFGDGNFENLESFYRSRDKILDLIRCIDGLIMEENKKFSDFEPSAKERAEISAILKAKDEWVEGILAQDLLILSCIEQEKSNIIKELQSTRKAKKAVHGYHSGSQIRQLDEKA